MTTQKRITVMSYTHQCCEGSSYVPCTSIKFRMEAEEKMSSFTLFRHVYFFNANRVQKKLSVGLQLSRKIFAVKVLTKRVNPKALTDTKGCLSISRSVLLHLITVLWDRLA